MEVLMYWLADINSCCAYVTRQSIYKEKIQDHHPLALCLSAILVPREVKCSYHPRAAVSAGHALLGSTSLQCTLLTQSQLAGMAAEMFQPIMRQLLLLDHTSSNCVN